MTPSRHRPAFVLALLFSLVALESQAFVRQFAAGFRPFSAAPTRIAFSWDMFSTRIERCDVFWSPPLPRPGAPLYHLHQLAAPLEWDFVLDRVADYRALAEWSCGRFGGPFRANLFCFTPEGKVVTSALDCR